MLVDPDEVRVGWFAADVAFALRDWSGRPDVVDRFLSGYRSARPFTASEESWLPALTEAAAAEQRDRLAPHARAVPDPAWPEWAHALDARLRRLIDS
jgi:Ser/Thr protein kinase RdoA (MazF antagonist)